MKTKTKTEKISRCSIVFLFKISKASLNCIISSIRMVENHRFTVQTFWNVILRLVMFKCFYGWALHRQVSTSYVIHLDGNNRLPVQTLWNVFLRLVTFTCFSVKNVVIMSKLDNFIHSDGRKPSFWTTNVLKRIFTFNDFQLLFC